MVTKSVTPTFWGLCFEEEYDMLDRKSKMKNEREQEIRAAIDTGWLAHGTLEKVPLSECAMRLLGATTKQIEAALQPERTTP